MMIMMISRLAASLLRGHAAPLLAISVSVVGPGSVTKAEGGHRDRSIESSVVKFFVFTSPPDALSPWQKGITQSVGGSGVVIEGGRILTNAHVVEDYASLEVKRAGMAERFPARVVHVGHQCDLALVTVDDPRFFDGAVPVPIGKLPSIQSRVDVYGFPIGGDTVSVTSGIVSRIEVDSYAHSREELLLVQIDAPVNPGNSGGPAITGGAIAGLAVQNLEDAENVGYIIPPPVILHFLNDVSDGRFDGFPQLRVAWQNLESGAHRRSLHMRDGETGVLVARIDHGSSGFGEIENGDVVLAVDGIPVANDGTVSRSNLGRVDFAHLVASKQVGETISLRLLRDGARIERTITLRHTPRLIPGRRFSELPAYLVFGGLVFRPVTFEYLTQFDEVPFDLGNLTLYQNVVTAERRQVVIISHVLPNPVNRGYQDWEDYIVASVNGRALRDMSDLARILDTSDGRWLGIVTEDGSHLTLDLEAVRAAQPSILARFGIAHDRSADLRTGEELARRDP